MGPKRTLKTKQVEEKRVGGCPFLLPCFVMNDLFAMFYWPVLPACNPIATALPPCVYCPAPPPIAIA